MLLDVWQGADHGVVRAQVLKLLHALAQLWAVQAEAVEGAGHSQVGIGHLEAEGVSSLNQATQQPCTKT